MNFAEYNVKDANLEEVLLALKSLDTVEAVALGGSYEIVTAMVNNLDEILNDEFK